MFCRQITAARRTYGTQRVRSGRQRPGRSCRANGIRHAESPALPLSVCGRNWPRTDHEITDGYLSPVGGQDPHRYAALLPYGPLHDRWRSIRRRRSLQRRLTDRPPLDGGSGGGGASTLTSSKPTVPDATRTRARRRPKYRSCETGCSCRKRNKAHTRARWFTSCSPVSALNHGPRIPEFVSEAEVSPLEKYDVVLQATGNKNEQTPDINPRRVLLTEIKGPPFVQAGRFWLGVDLPWVTNYYYSLLRP